MNAEEANKLFIYDTESGLLTWRKTVSCRARAGTECGGVGVHGYKQFKYKGKNYRTARVIWLMVMGEWPDEIDHINHDRTDNRADNLRSVTRMVNNQNRMRLKNNTSGVTGVAWNGKQLRWLAFISINGKRKHLGSFVSKAEAVAARAAAESDNGYHVNHGMPLAIT